MTWVATAVIGSAVIGGIASTDAAGKMANASSNAGNIQVQEYNQNRADLAPYRQVGGEGLNLLSSYLGLQPAAGTGTGAQPPAGALPSTDPRYGSLLKEFTPADLANNPGYQFQLQQGNQNITNQGAAMGSLLSGATLKELLRYGQGLAGETYNTAFQQDLQQKQSLYNMLAGISGTGQTSTTATAQLGQNLGNNLASNTIGAGNAQAAGIMGTANAFTSAAGQGLNAYSNYNLLKNILQPAGGGGAVGGGVTGYDPGGGVTPSSAPPPYWNSYLGPSQ